MARLTEGQLTQIVCETLRATEDGIIVSFNPKLKKKDLEYLNNYLKAFGLEASFNQVYNEEKNKLVKDRENVFVYREPTWGGE